MSNSVAPHKAITKLFVCIFDGRNTTASIRESERGSKQKQKKTENRKQKTFTDYQ